jgi:small GTP-binding protein
MAEQKYELKKVVLVGGDQEGKTQLFSRATDNKYNDTYKSTIGADFVVRACKSAAGAQGKLQIWDLAGQERYRPIIISYYRGAELGMLCISAKNLTDPWHREKLISRLQEFRRFTSYPETNIPLILVITKGDENLNDGVSAAQTEASARAFVAEHQLKAVIFTSAKNNQFGDNYDLSISPKSISMELTNWLFQQTLLVNSASAAAKGQQQDEELPSLVSKQLTPKTSSNRFNRFISHNGWELAIGIGLMFGMGVFFSLYLFIPPAGFVVSAVMLGLMNLGLGLAPSIYIGAFGVPLLAAALGFVAGFFGTKAVKHYACNSTLDTELKDFAQPSASPALSKLKPAKDEEENCVIGYFSNLRACCDPESEGYEKLDATSLSNGPAIL